MKIIEKKLDLSLKMYYIVSASYRCKGLAPPIELNNNHKESKMSKDKKQNSREVETQTTSNLLIVNDYLRTSLTQSELNDAIETGIISGKSAKFEISVYHPISNIHATSLRFDDGEKVSSAIETCKDKYLSAYYRDYRRAGFVLVLKNKAADKIKTKSEPKVIGVVYNTDKEIALDNMGQRLILTGDKVTSVTKRLKVFLLIGKGYSSKTFEKESNPSEFATIYKIYQEKEIIS
jgi:hypothetical protein